jgi:serine/threonine protein kinase
LDSDIDSQAAERVGSVLNDKWTLERLLGVGGMAAVYAGRHRNGARAAVKILHPELARHQEVRERFQREGYAANKVNHPGVVKVLDDDVVSTGPDAGSPYLVMELLEGESLQERLERGFVFGEREFLRFAADVLDVLQAAHERGVVHRDLKPENLFFAREEGEGGMTRVKVLDFGLARLLDSQAITTYGLALGTPSFMSPEQAGGRTNEIDGRTDLFALAATGFRLRAGRRIHEADHPVELVTKMARLPAPRIATVAADVSAPYARVIDRALEFNREDRYESAAAMGKDVQRALAELDAPPRPARVAPAARASSPERPPKVQPKAPSAEPTIELSEGDLQRSPVYGLDESIRIPKTGSIAPWLALLLLGGAAFALWRDDGRRKAVLDTLDSWRTSLVGPAASSGPGPGADAGSDPAGRLTGDAGVARTAGSTMRPAGIPSGASTHRPMPAKLGAGSAQRLPRPPGGDP